MSLFGKFSFKRGIKTASRTPVGAATTTPAVPPVVQPAQPTSAKKDTIVVMRPKEMQPDVPVYVTRRGDVNPNAIQEHPTSAASRSFIQAGISQVQVTHGFAIERNGLFTDSF